MAGKSIVDRVELGLHGGIGRDVADAGLLCTGLGQVEIFTEAANLDAETEVRVLEALRRASEGRTVLSVSHRIYENLGGRTIEVRAQA